MLQSIVKWKLHLGSNKSMARGHSMPRKQAGWTPMSPTTVGPIPLPQFTPVAKDPLPPTDEREKCLNLTHGWVRPVHGTKQKYMKVILQPTKGWPWKLERSRNPLESTEFQAVHPAIYSCGRWPKIRIHLGSGNWHDQLAWSLKRNRLEDWAPVDLR